MVNEGRTLAHSSKDHVVKVSNEADFILNRMRADDIRKGGEFEKLSILTTQERRESEEISDHFLRSNAQRYTLLGSRLKEKFLSLMIDQKEDFLNSECLLWKLDAWEDDLRRRRRLIRNPHGTRHEGELAIRSNINLDPIDTNAQEKNLLKLSKLQQQQKNQNILQINHEDEELSQVDERDSDPDFTGPIRYAVHALLICGTLALPGILAVARSSLLFDVDETDEKLKSLNSQVTNLLHFRTVRSILIFLDFTIYR